MRLHYVIPVPGRIPIQASSFSKVYFKTHHNINYVTTYTGPPHSTSCQHIPLTAGTEREQQRLSLTINNNISVLPLSANLPYQ